MNALRILSLVDRIVDEIERSGGRETASALVDHIGHADIVASMCAAQQLTFADLTPVRRLVRNALERRHATRTGRIVRLNLRTWSERLTGSTRAA